MIESIFDDSALHKVWTKAVGTHDYVKEDWRQLEGLIYKLLRDKRDLEKQLKKQTEEH